MYCFVPDWIELDSLVYYFSRYTYIFSLLSYYTNLFYLFLTFFFPFSGTSKDLYQIYKRFKQDKERIPPTPTITITTRNWRDWLGHKRYGYIYGFIFYFCSQVTTSPDLIFFLF
jgi:hypothetical protein